METANLIMDENDEVPPDAASTAEPAQLDPDIASSTPVDVDEYVRARFEQDGVDSGEADIAASTASGLLQRWGMWHAQNAKKAEEEWLMLQEEYARREKELRETLAMEGIQLDLGPEPYGNPLVMPTLHVLHWPHCGVDPQLGWFDAGISTYLSLNLACSFWLLLRNGQASVIEGHQCRDHSATKKDAGYVNGDQFTCNSRIQTFCSDKTNSILFARLALHVPGVILVYGTPNHLTVSHICGSSGLKTLNVARTVDPNTEDKARDVRPHQLNVKLLGAHGNSNYFSMVYNLVHPSGPAYAAAAREIGKALSFALNLSIVGSSSSKPTFFRRQLYAIYSGQQKLGCNYGLALGKVYTEELQEFQKGDLRAQDVDTGCNWTGFDLEELKKRLPFMFVQLVLKWAQQYDERHDKLSHEIAMFHRLPEPRSLTQKAVRAVHCHTSLLMRNIHPLVASEAPDYFALASSSSTAVGQHGHIHSQSLSQATLARDTKPIPALEAPAFFAIATASATSVVASTRSHAHLLTEELSQLPHPVASAKAPSFFALASVSTTPLSVRGGHLAGLIRGGGAKCVEEITPVFARKASDYFAMTTSLAITGEQLRTDKTIATRNAPASCSTSESPNYFGFATPAAATLSTNSHSKVFDKLDRINENGNSIHARSHYAPGAFRDVRKTQTSKSRSVRDEDVWYCACAGSSRFSEGGEAGGES
ncbi:hypothetical protein JCM10207_004270 [Rhodosporidiobolus poonsookiae]